MVSWLIVRVMFGMSIRYNYPAVTVGMNYRPVEDSGLVLLCMYAAWVLGSSMVCTMISTDWQYSVYPSFPITQHYGVW